MPSTERLLDDVTNASQLSSRLGKISLSRRAQYVHALIRGAMCSQERKDVLLSLSGPIAVEVVEELQEVHKSKVKCNSISLFLGQSLKADDMTVYCNKT